AGGRPRHQRPVPPAEPGMCSRKRFVMPEQCAVVGIGQTKHKKRRDDVSLPGLVREAAQRALDDAEMTWTDIEAVVLGKAPDPFHYLESCPSSDGACAMVLTNEAGGRRARNAAWVLGTAVRSELGTFPGRDAVRPQAGVECAQLVYEEAGIDNPLEQVDVAELYVPFSWYEPMWLEVHDLVEVGEVWRLVDEGAAEIGGRLRGTPSGCVLSSYRIGSS